MALGIATEQTNGKETHPRLASLLLPAERPQRWLLEWRGPRRRFAPSFHWRLSPKALSAQSLWPCVYAFRHHSQSTALKAPVRKVAPTTYRRPCTHRHSVHLALAFLFGAMDLDAPEQECDDPAVISVNAESRSEFQFRLNDDTRHRYSITSPSNPALRRRFNASQSAPQRHRGGSPLSQHTPMSVADRTVT
jgi:hypothetical protein